MRKIKGFGRVREVAEALREVGYDKKNIRSFIKSYNRGYINNFDIKEGFLCALGGAILPRILNEGIINYVFHIPISKEVNMAESIAFGFYGLLFYGLHTFKKTTSDDNFIEELIATAGVQKAYKKVGYREFIRDTKSGIDQLFLPKI